MDAAHYSEVEPLSDGSEIKIRALKQDDKADLLASIDRASARSLYRRFFAVKRSFSEKEIAFFLNVDFRNHVALVAICEDSGRPKIVGGARYIRIREDTAEMAFFVIDEYQGKGIGTLLMRHLAAIAQSAGLKELTADILADNTSMLGVFKASGLRLTLTREPDVLHAALQLPPQDAGMPTL
jgi:RimJ/RimL family protein N-acetyltransferase